MNLLTLTICCSFRKPMLEAQQVGVEGSLCIGWDLAIRPPPVIQDYVPVGEIGHARKLQAASIAAGLACKFNGKQTCPACACQLRETC